MDNIQDYLDSPIESLKGIAENRAKAMNSLGIFTMRDLLYHFPKRYEDRKIYSLAEAQLFGSYCFLLCVRGISERFSARGVRYLTVTTAEAVKTGDGSGYIQTGDVCSLIFFNMPYIRHSLVIGEIYAFYGKLTGDFLKREIVNPKFVKVSDNMPRFFPVYRMRTNISGYTLQKYISEVFAAIDESDDELEIFTEDFRDKHSLADIKSALRDIHNPPDETALENARRRLIYEEFFVYSLALFTLKKQREKLPAFRYKKSVAIGDFTKLLPFKLTDAQLRAIGDVYADLLRETPMSRMIQGDVGSGKTMIAAAAVFFVCKNHTQAVLMAPTDILANQHYESLSTLFESVGIKTELLTGSLKASDKRAALARIASGEAHFVIGTHAVIQKSVEWHNLTLAITDEQHRFGVSQRAEISSGDGESGVHTLVMSATPIPRTLALILYGDLDISVVNEMPPGRQKVDTFAVDSSYRERIYKFTRKLVGEGGQIFIVCPAVGEEDEEETIEVGGLKSVMAYYKHLSENIFPDIPTDYLHGKMKASAKDAAMEKFRAGETKIIVSTVVIEVGVNIPNAVMMIIENADRFGLSQLHQLRGRVGRGDRKSYCVLFSDYCAIPAANAEDKKESDSEVSESVKKRLDIMVKTSDGFEIAKTDIEIRGPGDLFGERQSGSVKFKIADIITSADILYEAASEAKNAIISGSVTEAQQIAAQKIIPNEGIAFN
ncbi:ATP-dependent DNA helicase RecG [Clostridia bacterium]|nr:ATP-dependent DNA helicase RecG [Clostridia bacterium]